MIGGPFRQLSPSRHDPYMVIVVCWLALLMALGLVATVVAWVETVAIAELVAGGLYLMITGLRTNGEKAGVSNES